MKTSSAYIGGRGFYYEENDITFNQYDYDSLCHDISV